jgi:hypothetical protein
VTLGIRPGNVVVSPTGTILASVTKLTPGVTGGATCEIGGWRCGLTPSADVREGDAVRVQIDHLVVFDHVTGRAIV